MILATVPSSGAFFTTYEACKSLLSPTPLPLWLYHGFASGAGELVSCLILTPAEVLKQNAQMVSRSSNPNPGSKVFDGNATMIALRKFNSPTQLWRGYTALTGRNLPFTAMQFPLFEHLRSRVHDYREARGLKTGSLRETGLVTAAAAGTSGSLAAVVTTPIDVVKTRIMLSASADHDKGELAQVKKDLERQGKDPAMEMQRMRQLAAKGGRASAFAVGKEILRA